MSVLEHSIIEVNVISPTYNSSDVGSLSNIQILEYPTTPQQSLCLLSENTQSNYTLGNDLSTSLSNKNQQEQCDDGAHVLLSIGAFLFLCGFLFPPLWLLGSFIPRQSKENKMKERWKLINRFFMVVFGTLFIITAIILIVLYATF